MDEEIKIDEKILQKYINMYQKDFAERFKKEKFKWEAVKHFQKNWDINAEKFLEMYKKAVSKTGCLFIQNGQKQPVKMILDYCEEGWEDDIKSAFENLFDEKKDINKRITEFLDKIETINNERNENYKHYHDLNTISVYLSLKYPDKYFIYKYETINKVCDVLNIDNKFKKNEENEKKFKYTQSLYNKINNIIVKNSKLIQLCHSKSDTNCYEDKNKFLLTQDFGYYISQKQQSTNNDQKEETDMNNSTPETPIPTPALNQILYGPPGTGKTYNTIIEAVKIANKEYYLQHKNNYEELKEKFDELKEKHQIEFVTFHQSYSYEEFVEGIKPVIQKSDTKGNIETLENSNSIAYELNHGIFKLICEKASKQTVDNFEEVYEQFSKRIAECDENDYYKIYTLRNNKVFGLKLNSNNNLNVYMSENFNKQGVITKENLKKHFEHTRANTDWYGYYDSIIEHLKKEYKLVSEQSGNKPHVLIIDEINRGNISKIFGELITLIEEDKRIGNDNEMRVTLPYSSQNNEPPFGVPNNLYIIGTMNTSDRSIASIDIALRRRFKFVEMMPKPELFKKVEIKEFKEKKTLENLLETLNNRITLLLDRDHQIGHSYFIDFKDNKKAISIEALKDIWFDEIMPLLNEYFYGDWDKLQAILGEAKSDKSSFIKKLDNVSFAKEYTCDEENQYNFNKECDFSLAMKNAFGDLFEEQENNEE